MATSVDQAKTSEPDERVTTIDISSFSYGASPSAIKRLQFYSAAYFVGAWIAGGLFFTGVMSTNLLLHLPAILQVPLLLLLLGVAFFPLWHRVLWSLGEIGVLAGDGDFRESDLDRHVPFTGVTLRLLLAQTRAFAASRGTPVKVRDTSPENRPVVWAIRCFAAIIALAGMTGMYLFGSIELVSVLSAFAVFIGVGLFAMAGNLLQRNVDELLALDRRKPTLLLRSFRDDELQTREVVRPVSWWLTFEQRRFEQGIAGSLHAFGPLIAIGAPGEATPQIGAARTYLAEDQWQGAVMRFMGDALFIVMIAGTTEWIKWELHRLIEMGRLQHLLILLPPDTPEGRGQRWTSVLASLTHTDWYPALATIDIRDLLLVQLRPDGALVAIRSGGSLQNDYQLGVMVAVYNEFCRRD